MNVPLDVVTLFLSYSFRTMNACMALIFAIFL